MIKLPFSLSPMLLLAGALVTAASVTPANSREGQIMSRPSKTELIESLELEQHIEGGYFKRTFQADHREKIATQHGNRFTLTSIFYLLTDESPIGHWHLNHSDIIHYFHLGEPITYYLIDADGNLNIATLGPDPRLGHQLQLIVKGGVWKASHLPAGEYGLISEAVAPGFDYQDMTLGNRDQLIDQFPQHQSIIEQFTR